VVPLDGGLLMPASRKPKPRPEPLYFGRPTLRERGWTDAIIARHLGEPDELAPNPHHRSGPPRKLYLITRVEAAEASPGFAADREGTSRRRESARKATATKHAAMLAHLARVAVSVPVLDRDELVRRACRHYNRRKEEVAMDRAERGQETDYTPATADSSPGFLDRISVNFLRHALSSFEDELAAVAGRVGVTDAYRAITRKVLDAIAAAYPHLKAECERQYAAKFPAGASEGTSKE
jgi:hypothetical protein